MNSSYLQVAIYTLRTEVVTSVTPAAQDSKQVKRIVGLDPFSLQFLAVGAFSQEN